MSGSDPVTGGAIEEHHILPECDQFCEEKHMEDNWNNNKNESAAGCVISKHQISLQITGKLLLWQFFLVYAVLWITRQIWACMVHDLHGSCSEVSNLVLWLI